MQQSHRWISVWMLGLLAVGCGAPPAPKQPKATRPPADAAKPEGGVGVQKGQLAPDIEGADLDGKSFKLSDYRGKVVLLDFWRDS